MGRSFLLLVSHDVKEPLELICGRNLKRVGRSRLGNAQKAVSRI
jgi:hypothetical protein